MNYVVKFIQYDKDHMSELRIKNRREIELAADLLPWRLHSSVGRASHRHRGGHGFDPVEASDFFSGLCL